MSTPNSTHSRDQDSQANSQANQHTHEGDQVSETDNGHVAVTGQDETKTDALEEQNTASANPPLVMKEAVWMVYFLPSFVVVEMWFCVSFCGTLNSYSYLCLGLFVFYNIFLHIGDARLTPIGVLLVLFLLVLADHPVCVIFFSVLLPLCYLATTASYETTIQCWGIVHQVFVQFAWPTAMHLKGPPSVGFQSVLALFVIGQAFWIAPGVINFELPGELLHQLGAFKFSQMNGNVIETFCNGAVYEGHVRQGWKHATGAYFTPWPVPCWECTGYATIQFPSETKSMFVFDNGHLRFNEKTVFLWGIQTHNSGSPNVCTARSLKLVDATLEIAHATSMECQALRDSVDHTDHLLTKIIPTEWRWIPLQWFNFKFPSYPVRTPNFQVLPPVDVGVRRKRLCFDRPLYEHACQLYILRQKFHELSTRNLSTHVLVVDMLNISVTALQANFYRVLGSVLTAEDVTFYLDRFVSMIGQDPSVDSVSEYSVRPSNVTFENIMIFAHRIHNFHFHAFHWKTLLLMHHRDLMSKPPHLFQKTFSTSEFREGLFKVFRLAREDSLVGLDHTAYHNLSLIVRSRSTSVPKYARGSYESPSIVENTLMIILFVSVMIFCVSSRLMIDM